MPQLTIGLFFWRLLGAVPAPVAAQPPPQPAQRRSLPGALALVIVAVVVIVVIVPHVGHAHLVEDRSQDPGADLFEQVLGPAHHVTAGTAGSYHLEHAIHPRAQHHGVGDGGRRRRVVHHHVGLFLEQGHHLADAGRAQQLGRIARQRAAWQHPQGVHRRGLEVGLDAILLVDHQVGKARLAGYVEQLVHPRPAQVGIDQDDPLAVLGQG